MKKALYSIYCNNNIIIDTSDIFVLIFFSSFSLLIGGSCRVSSLAYPTCMGVKYFVLVVMLASDGAIIVATGWLWCFQLSAPQLFHVYCFFYFFFNGRSEFFLQGFDSKLIAISWLYMVKHNSRDSDNRKSLTSHVSMWRKETKE